jgi:hypothetical protein
MAGVCHPPTSTCAEPLAVPTGAGGLGGRVCGHPSDMVVPPVMGTLPRPQSQPIQSVALLFASWTLPSVLATHAAGVSAVAEPTGGDEDEQPAAA